MTPQEKIEPLISAERIEANKKHGEAFASMKEAWAELKEEIEEAEAEMNNIGEIFEVLWAYIKADDDCSSRSTLETLRESAIRLIQEAIQVAGVCDKALGKLIPTFWCDIGKFVPCEPNCADCGRILDSGFCDECTDHKYFVPKERHENDVPPPMLAVDYLRYLVMMCDTYKNRYCEKCPLSMRNNKSGIGCEIFPYRNPAEAVSIVQLWANEHRGEVK